MRKQHNSDNCWKYIHIYIHIWSIHTNMQRGTNKSCNRIQFDVVHVI